MTWKKLLVCVMLLLTAVGCGARAEPAQEALDLRTALLEHGGCRFRAVIGADFGERVYSFTVDCCYSTEGTAKLTVLRPEELSGIAATVAADGVTVEFDGAALDFGPMAKGHISPIRACQVLGRSWTGGYIDSGGADGELERVTYLDGYGEAALTVDTWLDDGLPVYGEIAYENTRCLTVQLTDFRFEDEL